MTSPILSPLPVSGRCMLPNPAVSPRPGFEMPNLTYYMQVPSHSQSTTPTPLPLNDETDEVGVSASTSGDIHPPERVVSPAPTTSSSGLGKSKQLPPRMRTNTGRHSYSQPSFGTRKGQTEKPASAELNDLRLSWPEPRPNEVSGVLSEARSLESASGAGCERCSVNKASSTSFEDEFPDNT